MTKIAYLDCPTGIAGDMCLGALVDAGVPLDYLLEMLGRLGIAKEYHLWAERVQRNGQQATKVHVDLSVDEFHQETDDRAHAKAESFSPPTHSAIEASAATETDAIHARSQGHSNSHSHHNQPSAHSHASTTDEPHDHWLRAPLTRS